MNQLGTEYNHRRASLVCFHRPLLKKLCQEDAQNLAEDASLKQQFPEAMKIVRQEIGQLLRLVKDTDTGEESWTLERNPWAAPSPSDKKFTQSPEVSVNALWARAHPPTLLHPTLALGCNCGAP